MKLGYAFLANAAEFSRDGKLSVLGGDFDTVRASAYPAMHPILCIVVKLLVDLEDAGKDHELQIEFVGASGKPVGPGAIKMPFRLEQKDVQRVGTGAAFVGTIAGITIPAPGEYTFIIRVDGFQLGSLPLYAVQVPATPQIEKLESE